MALADLLGVYQCRICNLLLDEKFVCKSNYCYWNVGDKCAGQQWLWHNSKNQSLWSCNKHYLINMKNQHHHCHWTGYTHE